jgi:hypothetical protein
MGCAFLLWSLAPGPARAGDEYVESDTRMAARVLAAQGAEAFERREFAQALSLFERAGAIIQAPTITLMEARSLVELGRLVEGLEMYGATQRMLGIDPSNEVFRQAADAAARETEPLLQRVPTLRVRLLGANPSQKVEVQIDGKKIMSTLAAVDRPIDPGRHRIEAVASDGARAARDVTIMERTHEDVELTLTLPVAEAPPAPAPAPPDTHGSSRTLGWVLGGSGVAFTAVGAITGVMALDEKSDLDRACNPGCPPSKASDIQAFRRARTLSYVGFGLGALGMAGGAYLLWLAPSDNVALGVSPGFVAVAGTLR